MPKKNIKCTVNLFDLSSGTENLCNRRLQKNQILSIPEIEINKIDAEKMIL